MKVLSIKQPWASLIVQQRMKDIENRTWKTNFRGRILIHASSIPVKEGWEALTRIQSWSIPCEPDIKRLPKGAIIGSVEIVDCTKNNPSIWAEKDAYNWVLAHPILFKKPIMDVKGKLGLWEYELPEEYKRILNLFG